MKIIQRGWKKYKLIKGFRMHKLEMIWVKIQQKFNRRSPSRKGDVLQHAMPNDMLKGVIGMYYVEFMCGYVVGRSKEYEEIDMMFSSKRLFDYVTEARIRINMLHRA